MLHFEALNLSNKLELFPLLLQLCGYALQLSNCSLPGRAVPIAARKQVVATWVQTKRLLEEQIDLNLIISDKVPFSVPP